MPDYMKLYFAGERAIAYYAAPIGVALAVVVLCVWKFQWTNPLTKALAVMLAIMAAAALLVSVGMWIRCNFDVARLSASYQADPTATVQAEITRMERVNNNWPKLKLAWAALCVGAVLALLLQQGQRATGIALGVLLLGSAAFVTDVLAERRAQVYTADLATALKSTKP